MAAVTQDGLQEIPSLRTRTSDTFVDSRGVYTVQQSLAGSMNYQDATGAWQPIDDTVVPAQSDLAGAGFAYQNAANDYSVAFAAATGGTAFEQLTRHGATIDLAPLSAQIVASPPAARLRSVSTPPSLLTTTVGLQVATATVAANSVAYGQLFPATDVRYLVKNDGVKEALVLHDATAPSTFTFLLHTTGLQPLAASASTALNFVDWAGQTQFVMAPPTAFDANRAATPVSLVLSPGRAYA